MVEITLVVITHNEEANIYRCLNSAKDIADEILVIDSNSTDNTIFIAKKYDVIIKNGNFINHNICSWLCCHSYGAHF